MSELIEAFSHSLLQVFFLLCTIFNVKVNRGDSVHIRFSQYLLSIERKKKPVLEQLNRNVYQWHGICLICVMFRLILSSQIQQNMVNEGINYHVSQHFTMPSESDIC